MWLVRTISSRLFDLFVQKNNTHTRRLLNFIGGFQFRLPHHTKQPNTQLRRLPKIYLNSHHSFGTSSSFLNWVLTSLSSCHTFPKCVNIDYPSWFQQNKPSKYSIVACQNPFYHLKSYLTACVYSSSRKPSGYVGVIAEQLSPIYFYLFASFISKCCMLAHPLRQPHSQSKDILSLHLPLMYSLVS